MNKTTLLCVMAILCLSINSNAQGFAYDLKEVKSPLYVGDYIKRTMPLGNFINYKTNTATLNDFKDKLVLFSFWFTNCTNCIALFPHEEELQKQFDKDIQIILVTYEPQEKVTTFLKKLEARRKKPLELPVITGDTVLKKAMRVLHNPYYAWVYPTGKLAAHTSAALVNSATILTLQPELKEERAMRRKFDKEPPQSNQ